MTCAVWLSHGSSILWAQLSSLERDSATQRAYEKWTKCEKSVDGCSKHSTHSNDLFFISTIRTIILASQRFVRTWFDSRNIVFSGIVNRHAAKVNVVDFCAFETRSTRHNFSLVSRKQRLFEINFCFWRTWKTTTVEKKKQKIEQLFDCRLNFFSLCLSVFLFSFVFKWCKHKNSIESKLRFLISRFQQKQLKNYLLKMWV